MHTTDVVVIGAGPVGLFSIFECGMLNLQCHVIDALNHIGGQCIALYPEKPIYDIPACPVILASDLIKNLERQATPFHPVYHLGQQVTKLEPLEDKHHHWCIETSIGTTIHTRAIIIAAGVGAFGPNRPPLKEIETYERTSVHYYVKSREDFKNKKIVIAGGGDSAVDWALSLEEVAQKVYVVHRRNKFRATLHSIEKLHTLAGKGKLELIIPYQLSGIEGNGQTISSIVVENLDGHKRVLEAEVLLSFFGLSMNLGPIAEWGLGLDHHHIRINPLTTATNQKGIYAVGDIAIYENKLKLILIGFAEAAQTARSIRKFLYPEETLHFEYSTTKGPPISFNE